MAHRSYSVLVSPERWRGSLEELARRLAPVTHQSADRLAAALERGAVTLDADLRLDEARRIARQLERLSAPVEIRDGSDEVVESFGPTEDREHSSPTEAPEEEGESALDLGDLEAAVGEIFEEESSASWDIEEVGEPVEPPPEDLGVDEEAPWDDLLDESEETDDEDEPEVLEFKPDRPPSSAEGSDASAPAEPSGREFESGDPDSSETDRSEEGPESQRASAGWGDIDGAEPGGDGFAPAPESGGDFEEERRFGEVGGGSTPAPERDFDGAKIAEAFADREGAPGSEEHTFDDGPVHIPVLAGLLSALAPGAGQVYNGDSERAWEYALRAPLIVPWIESVRDAHERAVAIRRGEVPRPEEGAFYDSLGHLAVLYVGVFGFVGAVWLGVRLALDPGESTEADAGVESRPPEVAALSEARYLVHEARLGGWERAGRREVGEEDRFSMSREERAERLFRIGFEYCTARKYGMCESAMRRVAKLGATYRRDAYRLQVWANAQRDRSARETEMPDVRTPDEFAQADGADAGDAGTDAGETDPEAGSPPPDPEAGDAAANSR